MKDELYNLLTAAQARALLLEYSAERVALPEEKVSLLEANGRILAESIVAQHNLPEGQRSTMDGYAVRAQDTNGASSGTPIYLKIDGEVAMGEQYDRALSRGCCCRIWTGGFLPEGSDAVVMIEYTEEVDAITLEISKAVAVAENTMLPGEDLRQGETIFRAGHCLRAQDIGVLAAMGIYQIPVYQKLKVGIIASGDELVSPDDICPLGKIRDINTYTISNLLKKDGFIPCQYGIVHDDELALRSKIIDALRECDVLLLTGGSSVGVRDLTINVLNSMEDSRVFFHGISVRPGKPTIFARVGNKPVFGLPGPPVSAYVIVNFFVLPFLNKFSGGSNPPRKQSLQAIAGENIHSVAGREDYLRVRIVLSEEETKFYPTNQKSGLITSLTDSDGYACVPEGCEGIRQGQEWEVLLHE